MKTNKHTLELAIACAALSLALPALLPAQDLSKPVPIVPSGTVDTASVPPGFLDAAVAAASPANDEEERLKADIRVFDSERPEVAQAIFRLGECYRQLKRFEEARIQYARILREFPDSPDLVRESARLLLEFGQDSARHADATGGRGSMGLGIYATDSAHARAPASGSLSGGATGPAMSVQPSLPAGHLPVSNPRTAPAAPPPSPPAEVPPPLPPIPSYVQPDKTEPERPRAGDHSGSGNGDRSRPSALPDKAVQPN